MKKLITLIFLFNCLFSVSQVNTEKWKVFEISLKGPSTGNPFTEVILSATFTNGSASKEVNGFYDGEGIYRIRFMPHMEGKWEYITRSNQKQLNGKKGSFICTPPTGNNHGPVVVKDTFNLAYADGTRHFSFGTTCYGWVHQGDSLAELTLKTLSNGYFNKMRMCIFPKDYDWNKNEPLLYPFEGKPLTEWDYTRFNPAYFRNIEKRIAQLDSMGIEADLIVFHPYDRWEFQKMDRETDERYISYVIARFSAYKNVWWSMANEFDFMKSKTLDDWNRFLVLFAQNDPYQRLRGIHNGHIWFDHTHPLITHASVQAEDTWKGLEHREKYKKPVVFDEVRYEGNISHGWGNITAEELVNKFWFGFLYGAHVGHGETYVTENPLSFPEKSADVLWWSKGGDLKGKSHDRIKFLREIMESTPEGIKPLPFSRWRLPARLARGNDFFLIYYGPDQPRMAVLSLPKGKTYKAEIIDAWEMKITPVQGNFTGRSLIELPAKPYIALRLTSI